MSRPTLAVLAAVALAVAGCEWVAGIDESKRLWPDGGPDAGSRDAPVMADRPPPTDSAGDGPGTDAGLDAGLPQDGPRDGASDAVGADAAQDAAASDAQHDGPPGEDAQADAPAQQDAQDDVLPQQDAQDDVLPQQDAQDDVLPQQDAQDDVLPQQDAAPDAQDDAGVDAGVYDSGADALVDALPDAPDAGSISCSMGALAPASTEDNGAYQGPALAYASGVWGLAWRVGEAIYYNAVNSSGTIQIPAGDVVTISETADVTLSTPRLASRDGEIVLAYGERNDGTNTTVPMVWLVTPTTGSAASPATGQPKLDGNPVDVGGVTATPVDGGIVTTARLYSISQATEGLIDLFLPPAGTSQFSDALVTPVYATSPAYAADRVVVAVVENSTDQGGALHHYLPANLSWDKTSRFTATGDSPKTGSAAFNVWAAGAGSLVAVTWIDGQHSTQYGDAYLTLIDPVNGGRATPAGAVRVSPANTKYKYYPRVVFDGATLMASWLEETTGGAYQVMVARFDLDLNPVGAPWCATCVSGYSLTIEDYGLAAAAQNSYAVAFKNRDALNPYKQYFRRISCTGP